MKKFKFIIINLLLILSFFTTNVYASNGSYSISSNSSMTNGDTISVTFKIQANKMFYWQAYISYDSSKLELISGNTLIQGESDNAVSGQGSVSQTLKFKAKKTGTAYVAIAEGDKGLNINSDSEEINYSKVTKNITINEKKTVTYSSNNYLKSLSIEGYDLGFKKDNKDYSIEVPANTTKIKINASCEDGNARIEGAGEKDVNEGSNKFTVKVIAENGNTREYNINVNVKELEPINVTVDNKNYTIVRKIDKFPKLSSNIYTPTTIKYNDQDIPALKNDITQITLIALNDTDGNINLYIYDETNKDYKPYKELNFNKIIVTPSASSFDIPDGFEKTTLKIEEITITAYVSKKDKNYYIFNGINVENGKTNIYLYDKEENTIQRYKNLSSNSNKLKLLSADSSKIGLSEDTLLYISIGLGSLLIITYLVIIIVLIKKEKKKKNLNNNYKNKKNEDNND